MPAWKLVPQIISKKIKVFIYGTDTPLGKQLVSQLGRNEKIQLVEENEKFDLLIYLVGFGPQSWSESLSHTTILHTSLESSKKHRAKFVLVTPERATHFLQVAMSMVNQFSKNFGLISTHVAVDASLTVEDSAESVIRTFIKNYTYEKKQTEKAPPSQVREAKESNSVPVPSSSNRTAWGLAFLLLLPWLLAAIGWLSLYLALLCVNRSAERGSWQSVFSCSTAAYRLDGVVQPLTRVALGSSWVLNQANIQGSEISSFVQGVYRVSSEADKIYVQALDLSAGIFDQTSQVSGSQIAQLNQLLSQLLDFLAYLQADLKSLAGKPGPFSATIAKLDSRISTLRQQVNKALLVSGDLARLLGVDRPLTFIVLVQDSSELRATGGFIEGIIVGTQENGRVGDIQIIDATQADSLLKGQVEPPADLKLALGEKSWLLRDANWDPDFGLSARRVAWFVQKELSINGDLVLAVNLESLRRALKVMGPVELEGVGRVTADNLLEKQTQFYKVNSETGRFTLSLAEKLVAQLPQLKSNLRQPLAELAIQLLEQRQLMLQPITFDTSGLQQVGWSGQLTSQVCKSPNPCVSGSAYAVDSNIGLNKINSHVLREHSLAFNVLEDQVQGAYRINYTNVAPAGSGWPLGVYKNYLRVFIPGQVVVGDIKIAGQILSEDSYRVALERGGVVVGLRVEVSPNSSQAVEIEFKKPVPVSEKFHFQWETLNQPGIWSEPWSVTINYPETWLASTHQAATIASPGVFRYNQLATMPFRIDVDFVKWTNTP